MKTTLSTIVVGMVFLGLYYSPDVMAANNNPCSDDIALFCKDSKRSPASLMDCLERNESKLSPACKEYEVKMGGKKNMKSVSQCVTASVFARIALQMSKNSARTPSLGKVLSQNASMSIKMRFLLPAVQA